MDHNTVIFEHKGRVCVCLRVCHPQGGLPSAGGEGERAGGREGRHSGSGPGGGVPGCHGHHAGGRRGATLFNCLRSTERFSALSNSPIVGS